MKSQKRKILIFGVNSDVKTGEIWVQRIQPESPACLGYLSDHSSQGLGFFLFPEGE